MSDMELVIYNILNEIDKLDANIYSSLLKVYKEKVVNQVIEKMIDMDSTNVSKFEYYISKVQWMEESIARTLYDSYMVDLKTINNLSGEESRKLAGEINEIVVKLRKILDISEQSWVSDEVDKYLSESSDTSMKREVEELYNKFIYKRNMLVEGNLKFVIFVAKRYCRTKVDICEIIQIGNVGLMRASEKYIPSYNTCFTTYSYYWIKQNILKELSSIVTPFCVSHGMASFNISLKKAIEKLRDEYKREPLIEEIACYMGESLDKIRTCLLVFSECKSLDEPLNITEDENYTCLDTLVDKRANSFNIIMQKNMSKDLIEFFNNSLTEKEFVVLCHRYELFNYDYKKLEELGKMMGLSRERVRQIEKKASEKIKRKGRYLSKYVD